MATPYHLPKKRGALKSTLQNLSFLRGTQFWWSLTVATPLRTYWGLSFVLDLSDQICTFVLHDFAWYSCLFVYLCLMGCCMICCCLCCLLKVFPNFHSVCHSNNNVCTTFQQLVVVVTMDHRSSLDSSTQWRTHKLIA